MRIFVRCFIFLFNSFLHQAQPFDSFSHPEAENIPVSCMINFKPRTDLQFLTILISLSVNLYSSRPMFVFFTATSTADLKSICNHPLFQDFFQQYQADFSNFYLCIWLFFPLKKRALQLSLLHFILLISAHCSNPSRSIWIFILPPKVLDFYPFFFAKFDKDFFFPPLKLLKKYWRTKGPIQPLLALCLFLAWSLINERSLIA